MSKVVETHDLVDVPDYPGYKADRSGSVVSFKYRKPRALKQHLGNNGYLNVSMTRSDGIIQTKSVHRVIAATFHGPCPSGQEVRHLDGNSQHNAAKNLAYGTVRDNREDSEAHGTAPVGELHGMRKLSEGEVYQIRAACDSGVHTLREMEGMFRLEKRQIRRIGDREAWKSLPERRGCELTLEQEIRSVVRPAMSGDECWEAVYELMRKFNIKAREIHGATK